MSPKPVPSITHLQFLVLEALVDGEQAGRDIRTLLASHDVRRSAPAFYQMMARLEDGAFVEGWYDQKVVEGQMLKERRYRLTRSGRRALDETRAFYLEQLQGARAGLKRSNA